MSNPAASSEPLSTSTPASSPARPTGPGKRAARPAPKRTRAARASADKAAVTIAAPVAPPTQRVTGPVRVAAPSTEILTPASGRRRAPRSSDNRGSFLRHLPSGPILAGVAALAVSAGGAVTVAGPTVATSSHSSNDRTSAADAPGLGTDADTDADAEILEDRTAIVSRDSRRAEASEATEAKLVAKAEKSAAKLSKKLETITVAADRQAAKIEANQWVMPIEGYRLSATFGMSSSLWSTVHTGLDFAAPSGTPLRAVANGVITEVGYDGSYGNKTVLTLDNGTEIWYCHQTSTHVSVGDAVVGGEVIGTVGSTGNSTGPHLHLEIRPGGGGPIDPYSGLMDHGLHP